MLIVKEKINRGAAYGLQIPVEHIFYDNEKATLDSVDGNATEKNLRCLKLSQVFSNLYFVF